MPDFLLWGATSVCNRLVPHTVADTPRKASGGKNTKLYPPPPLRPRRTSRVLRPSDTRETTLRITPPKRRPTAAIVSRYCGDANPVPLYADPQSRLPLPSSRRLSKPIPPPPLEPKPPTPTSEGPYPSCRPSRCPYPGACSRQRVGVARSGTPPAATMKSPLGLSPPRGRARCLAAARGSRAGSACKILKGKFPLTPSIARAKSAAAIPHHTQPANLSPSRKPHLIPEIPSRTFHASVSALGSPLSRLRGSHTQSRARRPFCAPPPGKNGTLRGTPPLIIPVLNRDESVATRISTSTCRINDLSRYPQFAARFHSIYPVFAPVSSQ
jgi:hypothetical protein